MTPIESERYTCSARKFCQMSTRPATAWSKRSARHASAAALIAPADVPAITGNGLPPSTPLSRRICATAFSTPTW
jgi:hypothetical protein